MTTSVETKKISIHWAVLTQELILALMKAESWPVNGWRLPLYTNEKGKIWIGNWLTSSIWIPLDDYIELPIWVEKWELGKEGLEEGERQCEVYEQARKIAHKKIEQLRSIKGRIFDVNNNYELVFIFDESYYDL